MKTRMLVIIGLTILIIFLSAIFILVQKNNATIFVCNDDGMPSHWKIGLNGDEIKQIEFNQVSVPNKKLCQNVSFVPNETAGTLIFIKKSETLEVAGEEQIDFIKTPFVYVHTKDGSLWITSSKKLIRSLSE